MLDQYSKSGSPLLFDLAMENKIRSWTNIKKKLDIYLKKSWTNILNQDPLSCLAWQWFDKESTQRVDRAGASCKSTGN